MSVSVVEYLCWEPIQVFYLLQISNFEQMKAVSMYMDREKKCNRLCRSALQHLSYLNLNPFPASPTWAGYARYFHYISPKSIITPWLPIGWHQSKSTLTEKFDSHVENSLQCSSWQESKIQFTLQIQMKYQFVSFRREGCRGPALGD